MPEWCKAFFSAHWWGRLGSFWVRFLHQAIFVVAHALFLFVDDFMLLQRKDVLPLAAAFVCILMQVFGLPISWRKADLHCAIDWIGWRCNFSSGAIYLQVRKRSKLLDLISQMISHSRIPKKALEQFLGLALWIIQIFPQMRSSLHYLFSDLRRPPGTQYSVDPGYWPITASCLTDRLHFSSRPAGTAIPAGSKLISIRHQPVKTLPDVHSARLTEYAFGSAFWILHHLDAISQWTVKGFFRHISIGCSTRHPFGRYIHCKIGQVSQRLMHALPPHVSNWWIFEISIRHKFIWFSQRWTPKDFSSLGITVSDDMQRDISCYEALANWHYYLSLLECRHLDASIFVFHLGVTIQEPNLW